MKVEAFRALLLALDTDEEKAAQEYRQLHGRLVRFFDLNLGSDPQTLADEALDRLARRIADSTIEIESPAAFVLGIARHLLQEDERRRIRESNTASEWVAQTDISAMPNDELLERVEHCLGQMRTEQQELLRSYYRSTGREKIEHHRRLAAQLGLSLNALRNRLMRARRELDDCVRRHSSDISRDRSTKL